MKKILLLALVMTPLYSMNPLDVLLKANAINQTIKRFLVIPKPIAIPHSDDLDACNTALALALNEKDTYVAPFLLTRKMAQPNYIIAPELIDKIKSGFKAHEDQSDHKTLSNLQNQTSQHEPEGIPVFYYAQDSEAVRECIIYGAAIHERYISGNTYGNVLTYIIDNPQYHEALIKYYLEKNVGTYAPSHTNEGGSILHHLVHVLSASHSQQNIKRLYTCALHIISARPHLVDYKNNHGKTPLDCFQTTIQKDSDALKQRFSILLDTQKGFRE